VKIETRPSGATYVVRCTCGFAHDSHAKSGADAIAEFVGRHKCEGTWSFEALQS
jgi:hypothetical protein